MAVGFASPIAVGQLGLVEARLCAYLMWAAAARSPVTPREMGAVPGPGRREIGVRAALQIARDLMDSGTLVLPGLEKAGLDQAVPVRVTSAATQPPPCTPRTHLTPNQSSARHPSTAPNPTSPPPRPVIGTLGRLKIYRDLPDPLRQELLDFAAEVRAGTDRPGDLAAIVDRQERKATLLARWAALPVLGTDMVRTEAERAVLSVTAVRAQLANQQARTARKSPTRA
ncbi:hypothetical protein ACFVH7_37535 [Kitasatospora indigofera]|uniref:hypothetical protein n=1 Tax=Kitasatospora indigofera TaxID=67307 RepID=UPI00363CAF14